MIKATIIFIIARIQEAIAVKKASFTVSVKLPVINVAIFIDISNVAVTLVKRARTKNQPTVFLLDGYSINFEKLEIIDIIQLMNNDPSEQINKIFVTINQISTMEDKIYNNYI